MKRRNGDKVDVCPIILIIAGILCAGYFIFYACKVDLNNKFTYFWLLIGLAGIAGGSFLRWSHTTHKIFPLWFRRGGLIFLGICLLSFLIVEGIIIGYGKSTPQAGADYMIVLGARVRGERVVGLLARRLNAAAEYLEKNPDTKVVLSGGQGAGETISEAEAMRRYLSQKGIDESRMILEDESTNTDENLEFSKQKMDDPDAKVVIVSNDFHIFRALRIAKKKGIENAEGLGASTVWYTVPNMFVREAFAVIKYTLCGQL